MVCEEYRDGLMALLDGEVTGAERESIEHHVSNCPNCNSEYSCFQKLSLLTHKCHLPQKHTVNWQNYYTGVCRKLEGCASWRSWTVVSIMLLTAGCLMVSGFPQNVLAMMLGATAVATGGALVWLSYFCNCSRNY